MIRKTGAVILAAFLGLSASAAGDAEASKKKKRKKPAQSETTPNVNVRALGELMGPYKFGMSKKDVLRVLSKQIDEKYAERIKETQDVYQQDKLRRDKAAEVDRIKKTFVEFKGTKSGWDVSIIDDQFAHNTDESMMVFWENEPGSGKDQRRFFFFHNGQLYKMFIALNSGMLKGDQRTFAYFQNIMEARYGKGKVSPEQGRTSAHIDWRTKNYHLKAIDKLEFHGSFCLVIAEPSVEQRLEDIRASARPAAKRNAVVDAMIDGEEPANPSLNENKAQVDAVLRGN
jgi:hypothetical protein